MKTPTLKVSPALKGPNVGAPALQLVADVEAVIQTRPVPGEAWAYGTKLAGVKIAAARRRGSDSIRRFFSNRRLYMTLITFFLG